MPDHRGTAGKFYEKDVDHVDHSLVICHSRSQSLGHGCGDCRNRHVLPVAFGMMVSDSGHFLASISFPIERFDYFVPVHRRPHLQTPPPLPPMAQRRRPPCRHSFIGGSCFLVALPPSGSCDSPPKHLFVAAMSWWLAQAARPASGMPRSASGKAAGAFCSATPLFGSLKRPPSRLGDLHAQNFDRLAAAHHALRARGREVRADQFVDQLKREAVGQ